MRIFSIIDEYVNRSVQAVEQLRKATGKEDLMNAWRRGELGRTGSVDGIYYEFHGSGVFFENAEFSIDFDFLPGGAIGGFDSWKLWRLVQDSEKLSSKFSCQEEIQVDLEKAFHSGKIAKVKNTNLYVVAEPKLIPFRG